MTQTFKVGQAPWEIDQQTKGGGFPVGQAPWEVQDTKKPNKLEQVQPDSMGATFPAVKDESLLSGATKLVGNIPSSGYGFIKNTLNLFNPKAITETISKIPSEFSALVEESGGVGSALKQGSKQLLPTLYGSLVPKATQQIISGDFESARNTITNDPVGQILPYILLAKGVAEKAGKGAQFDQAMSKIASPVTKPASMVGDLVKNTVNKSVKFGTSQATGLSPETISKVISDPKSFTKEIQATFDRKAIADEIKNNLDLKKSTLKETGIGYQDIRNTNTPISVEPNLLNNLIKETTGIEIKNGKLTTSPNASIRDASDVRALQNLYDQYQPLFDRGAMTSNEFLNLRTDLGNLAKFGRELTKSKPLENLSGIMRGKLNTAVKGKIPGLEELDANFSTQITELNRLQKGLLDKNGNLTDFGINRIANATGKGKDLLLSRLEEINPGVTQKIQVLKAIEDIKNAGGQKVGTYARAGGFVTGVATLNPVLIVGSILAIPEIAVPILRGIGMSTPKITSTIKLLQGSMNNAPVIAQNLLSKDITTIKPKLGLSIADVTKMTPEELSASGVKNVTSDNSVTNNNPISDSLNSKLNNKSSENKPNNQSNKGVSNSHTNNNTTFLKDAKGKFAGSTATNWSKLQKTNPELFNTGILRKNYKPQNAVGEIPKDVHTMQGKWQNYGQYDEIPADVVYKRVESGSFKGEYEDVFGNPVIDGKTGNVLRDVYDDTTGEWIKPNVSNQELRNVLLKQFETSNGKKYLNEVIKALPKNSDGTINAYRVGTTGQEGIQSYTLSEGMAKTFSNQGTDVLPAGTPGLPQNGYKDFGKIPVNVVKIDPKGIRAWSPYDAEILVEPKFVKIGSQSNKSDPATAFLKKEPPFSILKEMENYIDFVRMKKLPEGFKTAISYEKAIQSMLKEYKVNSSNVSKSTLVKFFEKVLDKAQYSKLPK